MNPALAPRLLSLHGAFAIGNWSLTYGLAAATDR